jgi:hypothetical protein
MACARRRRRRRVLRRAVPAIGREAGRRAGRRTRARARGRRLARRAGTGGALRVPAPCQRRARSGRDRGRAHRGRPGRDLPVAAAARRGRRRASRRCGRAPETCSAAAVRVASGGVGAPAGAGPRVARGRDEPRTTPSRAIACVTS